jgi:hypothetical protein
MTHQPSFSQAEFATKKKTQPLDPLIPRRPRHGVIDVLFGAA